MRTWLLFSAFWLAETISPDMVYSADHELLALMFFVVGFIMDFIDFSVRNKNK